MPSRVLVAGIGNVLLGDDGFGVEVVRRLLKGTLPDGVVARDFGIRGIDLAYALAEPWDGAILVDALSRGGEPGTIYVIDPRVDGPAPAMDAHSLDPASVLSLVSATGGTLPPFVRVVGGEPGALPAEDEVAMGLSPALAGAIDDALSSIHALLSEVSSNSEARPPTN